MGSWGLARWRQVEDAMERDHLANPRARVLRHMWSGRPTHVGDTEGKAGKWPAMPADPMGTQELGAWLCSREVSPSPGFRHGWGVARPQARL